MNKTASSRAIITLVIDTLIADILVCIYDRVIYSMLLCLFLSNGTSVCCFQF